MEKIKIFNRVIGVRKIRVRHSLILTAVLMCLLQITATDLWAKEYRVVTMYFAGTGATHNWWLPATPVDFEVFWLADLETYFEKPELLATLHRQQIASGSGYYDYPQHEFQIPESGIKLNHGKFFIDGAGTLGAPTDRLEDRKDPNRPGALWGWEKINAQAATYLKTITDFSEEGIILNVVGWSRGGPSAIMFARLVAMENKNGGTDNVDMFRGKVKRINILVFDPVIGNTSGDCKANPTLLKPENFDFSGLDIVNQYVGIYSWDERSLQFAPLVPIGIEKRLVFGLPGSHETLVGNVHNSGHSVKGEWDYWVWWPCATVWSEAWPFNPPPAPTGLCRGRSYPIDSLTSVSDFSALLSMKFLGSPEWGGARFDNVINPPCANTQWFVTFWLPPFQVEAHFIDTYFADYETVFADYLGGSKTFIDLFDTYTSRFLAYGGYSYMKYIAFVPWVAGGGRYSADSDRPCFIPNPGSVETLCYQEGFLGGQMPVLDSGNRWAIHDNILARMGRPPVADAGPDRIWSAGGQSASVTLDGSGSYDPDNSPLLAYEWTDCGTGAILAAGYDSKNPTVELSPGIHAICLKVDDAYYSDSDTVQITVSGPPVARCKNVTVSTVPGICSADSASVDDGSFDVNGGPVTTTQAPAGPYALGSTTVTLMVVDADELTATCSGVVTVVDQEPPAITCSPVVAECMSPEGTTVEFTATASDNCPGLENTACTPPSGAVFALGETRVSCSVIDAAHNANSCATTVRVHDSTPPAGFINFPAAGACFGRAAVPVTLLDSFIDRCDLTVQRSYVPPPGPSYGNHGDYQVVLTAADDSGNSASGAVGFSIDLTPPKVKILMRPGQRTFPRFVPFGQLFTDSDEDGAIGGVVHEVVSLDGCVVYDGFAYGNQDGLLLDEHAPATEDELCRLVRVCEKRQWRNPELAVRATDCGGNTTTATLTIPGAFQVSPGRCQ